MSTAPDGSPRSTVPPAAAASSRRSARAAEQEPATRRRSTRAAEQQSALRRRLRSTVRPSAEPTSGRRRFDWMGLCSILIPIAMLPASFFVWFSIISLGSFPDDQHVGDLIVALVLTALVHAVLLLGILFAIASLRSARRRKRWGIVGWVGIVLGALVIVYWELLVSPWIVDLWNKATGAA